MENNILKVDLDKNTKKELIDELSYRLKYLNSFNLFKIEHIDKIEAGYKQTWNVKLYLNKNYSETAIIMLQLLLGSDWRKETHTIINHFVLNMEYSNRMFDIKTYKQYERDEAGNITGHKFYQRYVTKTDITQKILQKINDMEDFKS